MYEIILFYESGINASDRLHRIAKGNTHPGNHLEKNPEIDKKILYLSKKNKKITIYVIKKISC